LTRQEIILFFVKQKRGEVYEKYGFSFLFLKNRYTRNIGLILILWCFSFNFSFQWFSSFGCSLNPFSKSSLPKHEGLSAMNPASQAAPDGSGKQAFPGGAPTQIDVLKDACRRTQRLLTLGDAKLTYFENNPEELKALPVREFGSLASTVLRLQKDLLRYVDAIEAGGNLPKPAAKQAAKQAAMPTIQELLGGDILNPVPTYADGSAYLTKANGGKPGHPFLNNNKR
jgi:hypothetical protein